MQQALENLKYVLASDFPCRLIYAYRSRQLAVELGREFNGEIINGDAMQMYQGLPIITNKLPEHERSSIPHHLLGTVPITDQPWTVTKFVSESQRTVGEIHARGTLPILVGGTHYYAQALLLRESLVAESDQDAEPSTMTVDTDPESKLRGKTWPILSAPTAEIYAKLMEVDPVMAKRWHPNDRRHVQRSLEIWLQTGKTASTIYEEQYQRRTSPDVEDDGGKGKPENDNVMSMETPRLRYPSLILWLETRDDVLRGRQAARVEDMMANGMVAEALSIETFAHEHGSSGQTQTDKGRGIWISIGYKELKPYLQALRGDPTLQESELHQVEQECIERTKIATRQYARSQKVWIRRRLTNTLDEAGATGQLFLLDSSDLGSWDEHITIPSRKLVQKFLDGASLPDPSTLSPLAYDVLPKAGEERRQTIELRKCDLCDKILMTEGEWEGHLTSRRHKKAMVASGMRGRGTGMTGRSNGALQFPLKAEDM